LVDQPEPGYGFPRMATEAAIPAEGNEIETKVPAVR
jgi:hypothetical protein